MAKSGLRSRLQDLFSRSGVNEAFFDDLEDMLIEGDVGVHTAMAAVGELRTLRGVRGAPDKDEIQLQLRSLLADKLSGISFPFKRGNLNFVLVLGVNGVGKTTSIAKLAAYVQSVHRTDKILLAAGDTFRAAAISQLKTLGDRLGFPVVSQNQGSDSGSVIFDSIDSAKARGSELVLADTAGRMHTKEHLVRELEKIDNIAQKKIEHGYYHKLLVIDATTGQNGLRQAEVFHQAIGIDSIFLAKYDSTSKGGIAIAIGETLNIPLSFLGVGEKPTDLLPFQRETYLSNLLGL